MEPRRLVDQRLNSDRGDPSDIRAPIKRGYLQRNTHMRPSANDKRKLYRCIFKQAPSAKPASDVLLSSIIQKIKLIKAMKLQNYLQIMMCGSDGKWSYESRLPSGAIDWVAAFFA